MIMKLSYYPPKDTKYKWHPPELQHRPWYSEITFTDRYRGLYMFVSRGDDGLYQGYVNFTDIYNHRTTHDIKKRCVDPLEMLLTIEAFAEDLIAKQGLPAWADEALAAGWRPPSKS